MTLKLLRYNFAAISFSRIFGMWTKKMGTGRLFIFILGRKKNKEKNCENYVFIWPLKGCWNYLFISIKMGSREHNKIKGNGKFFMDMEECWNHLGLLKLLGSSAFFLVVLLLFHRTDRKSHH